MRVVLDFKMKLPFEVEGLQAPEKISELSLKENYWTEHANAETGDREETHKYIRQAMYFEGAINSLKFVLKENEV